MSKLLWIIALGTVVIFISARSVNTQSDDVLLVKPVPGTPVLTSSYLTLREVIEIIADFEIRHPIVPQTTPWYGVTEADNRVIFVIENADAASKRKTMIHELIHVARRLRAGEAATNEEEETVVKQQAEEVYAHLFGR